MKSLEKLKLSSDHLFYEFMQMVLKAKELQSGKYCQGHPTCNALLEAFVLHTRNLLDFIYGEKNSDDVVAVDYFKNPDEWTMARPKINEILNKARKRANKEVAHLTYSRLKVKKLEKSWRFVDIAIEIVKLFDIFVKKVSPEFLHSSWKTYEKYAIKYRT